jgi:prepilin-type N-terminal cleavage/methylation domain-containing protein
MPISTTGPASGGDTEWPQPTRTPPLSCAGFTLLEISLVILIMGVVLTLTIPRFRDPGRAELLAQSRHMVLTFRLLRSEAVLNGSAYRLNYDLDQQRYWVTPEDAATDLSDFAHDIGALARGTRIESPVGITDVVLPTLAGKIAQGQIFTIFYPDGSIDPTVIHLGNGREAYTLYVNPMNGRLLMEPGYHDVEYGS